jgi:hypothetical protein
MCVRQSEAETPMFKTYRGQRYELAGTKPYVRRDGSKTHLTVWPSCAVCGEPFELQTSLAAELAHRLL